MRKTLRKSDCITQKGNNQFLVLLIEAHLSECEIVKNRILEKWNQTNSKNECKITFEMDSIGDCETN